MEAMHHRLAGSESTVLGGARHMSIFTDTDRLAGLPHGPRGFQTSRNSDMVDTMRPQRFYAGSRTLAVEDVLTPEPGPGELLVQS
jgi:hypothetical protein